MKKLLIAMLIGAGLAYLFDPDNGVRRRDEARHKVDSIRNRTAGEPDIASDGATSPMTATTTPTSV